MTIRSRRFSPAFPPVSRAMSRDSCTKSSSGTFIAIVFLPLSYRCDRGSRPHWSTPAQGALPCQRSRLDAALRGGHALADHRTARTPFGAPRSRKRLRSGRRPCPPLPSRHGSRHGRDRLTVCAPSRSWPRSARYRRDNATAGTNGNCNTAPPIHGSPSFARISTARTRATPCSLGLTHTVRRPARRAARFRVQAQRLAIAPSGSFFARTPATAGARMQGVMAPPVPGEDGVSSDSPSWPH